MTTKVGRRAALKGALAIAATIGVRPAPAAQGDPASLRPRAGDVIVKLENSMPVPIAVADVPERSAPLLVWAMDPATKIVRNGSRLNQIILMRLPPDKLAAPTRSRSAEGVVAYTAICTHGGCEVVDWLADEQALSCSCHSTLFDPADAAVVVEGPATRALPALPLAVRDGHLVVAGPFSAEVGFESA